MKSGGTNFRGESIIGQTSTGADIVGLLFRPESVS